ncbi:lysis system o-spanin lipoprotein Rz1 [Escherichia coli]|nr:lysis system o-spanin lipoprotein Rz1 [Escherichia coli]
MEKAQDLQQMLNSIITVSDSSEPY